MDSAALQSFFFWICLRCANGSSHWLSNGKFALWADNAEIEGLKSYHEAVRQVHAIGLPQRYLNKYNSIVTKAGTKYVDFEMIW